MSDEVPRPDADLDPTALLEDWLASTGEPEVASAETAASDPGAVLATSFPDEGATIPATLLDALGEPPHGAEPAAVAEDGAPAPVDVRPPTRLVLFGVAESIYGAPQQLVTEVSRVPAITPVPWVPGWVRGVISLRGDVFSVVDLRVLLGHDATSLHTGRLLLVRLSGEELSLALLVDRVEQIVNVAADDVRPPAGPLEGALAPYVTGVTETAGRLVAVLDLERLLQSADIRQFEDRREEASCEART